MPTPTRALYSACHASGYGAASQDPASSLFPLVAGPEGFDLAKIVAGVLLDLERADHLPLSLGPASRDELADAVDEGILTKDQADQVRSRFRASPHLVTAVNRHGAPVTIVTPTLRIAEAVAGYYDHFAAPAYVKKMNRAQVRKAVRRGLLPATVLRYL